MLWHIFLGGNGSIAIRISGIHFEHGPVDQLILDQNSSEAFEEGVHNWINEVYLDNQLKNLLW
ncbi:MAG: hypothetical protein ONB32_16420 [candidate division KSB1 bacterium]|nr:hypothetical protein [candidate division KSB1 bacterium]